MADFGELSNQDEGPIATVNVIPFVDIVLVLLVIFMLTATTIARRSLVVDLPQATRTGETPDSTVNIVINRAGDVFLNGVPSTPERVGWQVRKARAPYVVVAADKGVAYGFVMTIIDVAKENGAKGFALNIERKSESPVAP